MRNRQNRTVRVLFSLVGVLVPIGFFVTWYFVFYLEEPFTNVKELEVMAGKDSEVKSGFIPMSAVFYGKDGKLLVRQSSPVYRKDQLTPKCRVQYWTTSEPGFGSTGFSPPVVRMPLSFRCPPDFAIDPGYSGEVYEVRSIP